MTSYWTMWNFSFDLQRWNLRCVWWLSCGSEYDSFRNSLLDGALCWHTCTNKWNNLSLVAPVHIIHVLIATFILTVGPNWQIQLLTVKNNYIMFWDLNNIHSFCNLLCIWVLEKLFKAIPDKEKVLYWKDDRILEQAV